MSEAEYEAPEGAIWVCGACGKSADNRRRVGDESCFVNAILCRNDETLKRQASGRVCAAEVFVRCQTCRVGNISNFAPGDACPVCDDSVPGDEPEETP